eukprot:4600949-Prymnesium_polylepis.1
MLSRVRRDRAAMPTMPYRCCIALGQTVSAPRCSHQRRWHRSADGRARGGGRAMVERDGRSCGDRDRDRLQALAH